jgi:hypothetical protein
MAAAEARPDFRAMIAELAYFKAEQRGFAPGYEVSDWLEAEQELQTDTAVKPKKPAAKKPKRSAANGKK